MHIIMHPIKTKTCCDLGYFHKYCVYVLKRAKTNGTKESVKQG